MRVLLLAFAFSFLSLSGNAQAIFGNVNSYTSVTAIAGNVLTVTTTAGFSVGNLALIIQMKGATIDQANTVAYGNILAYNDAGNFEYVRVTAIAGNQVTLQNPLCRTYTTSGLVQLVRVPEYVNPNVSATLTGQAWNGTTGGIIAIDVSGTLTLNANIDASGIGFRGGNFTTGGFGCNNNNYRLGLGQSGNKGEGIAAIIAGQETAMGKIANGGGGANPGNPGGGGGSNFGAGGLGGREYSGCGASIVQGRGGVALSNATTKVFMGGGGGGGFRDNGQTVTAGSNGGGIVLIRAANITGNGFFIRSNGLNITIITNDEGAGGGGAGGSVLLFCPAFTTNLNVQAIGGDGGDNYNNIFTTQCHGPGGGGGGGLLWTSLGALPGNVAFTATGGIAGNVGNPASPCYNTPNQGTNGGNGGVLTSLAITGGAVTPVNLGPDVAICPGASVTLDAGPGYTNYVWQNAANTQTINVSAPGDYHVTVTGTCGLTDRDTVTVTLLPAPVVNLGPDLTVCSSTTPLTLDAGAGMTSYLWQNGAGAQTFSVTTSGTYHVTITAPNSCSDRDTVNVIVNPNPVISIGPDIVACAGPSYLLDPGPGFAAYLWQDGSNNQTFTTSISGLYHVTVTDANNCTDRDSISITVNPNPVIDLGNDTLICAGSSLLLDPGAGFSTYLWQNGAGTQTFTVANQGLYHVTVTDANNCTDRDTISVIVNNPVVNLGPDVSFCAGASHTFIAAGAFATWQWNTGATTSSLTVNSTGNYSVTVTDAAGCTATDAAAVLNVWPLPTPNIGPDQTVCAGSFLTLNAGPGYSAYQWSSGPTTQTANAAALGPYAVTVTDANGCTGSDVMMVTAVLPLPAADLGPDQNLCFPATTLLNPGGGADTYQWSSGSTSQTITVGSTGTYYVTATNSCGSVVDAINIIVFPSLPVLDLGPVRFICNDAVTIEANESFPNYLWNTSATTGFITVAEPGIYWLTVSNECGSATDSIEVIEECEPVLFWPNAMTPNGDGLNDDFHPTGDNMDEFSMRIFDRWGNLIFESLNQNDGWNGMIRNQMAPEGVYVYVSTYRYTFRLQEFSLKANGSVTLIR